MNLRSGCDFLLSFLGGLNPPFSIFFLFFFIPIYTAFFHFYQDVYEQEFLISDFSKGAALIGETIVFICHAQQAFFSLHHCSID